jgi:hypothetical protein
MNQSLNIRAKPVKPLEKTGRKSNDIRFGGNFLPRTPKARTTKENSAKLQND